VYSHLTQMIPQVRKMSFSTAFIGVQSPDTGVQSADTGVQSRDSFSENVLPEYDTGGSSLPEYDVMHVCSCLIEFVSVFSDISKKVTQSYFSQKQCDLLYRMRYVKGLYDFPGIRYRLFFMLPTHFESRFDPLHRLSHIHLKSYRSESSLDRFSVPKYIRI
jgi:hypothetical protein